MSDAQSLQVHGSFPFQTGYIEGCPILLLLEWSHVVPDLGDIGECLNIAHPAEHELLYLPALRWRDVLLLL